MTTEVLQLSGLDAEEAMEAANELLSDREKHPFLSRMLVVDDTAALVDHAWVYQRLLTARRLKSLLCVALGPPGPQGPEGLSPQIRIPANISSSLGSAVLWVSDPRGVDWQLSAAAIANGHAGGQVSGLDYLLGVLSVDEVFDKVLATMVSDVRNGVASPGLRLAGADDEAASFAAALALAIERLTGPGSGLATGTEEPFISLIPGSFGMIGLTEGGELAGYRDRIGDSVAVVSATLGKPRGGLLRRGEPDVRDDVIAIGKDLSAFRDRVARLFTDADSAGDLTEVQRGQVTAAGVELPEPSPRTDPGADGEDANRSVVSRAAVQAARRGDTLPRVTRRLNLTAQQLTYKGSVSYLPEVEKLCPAGLLDRLASPAPRPPGKTEPDVRRRELGLVDAARAAHDLAALVVTVAGKEWSGGAAVADEITRIRIALDGINSKLAEHAAARGATVSTGGARGTRLIRLGESLMPILCDLVDAALAAEASTPSASGQEAYERAQVKTGDLIEEWTRHAALHGATSPPPFAKSVVLDHTYADDNMAAIREALRHDPRQEMWQLCGPDDVGVLDVARPSQVVAFAPRLTKDALGVNLPPDTTWTRSGSYAGLIRLVPLRPAATQVEWTDPEDSVNAVDASAESQP
jgi:hypothetical protein